MGRDRRIGLAEPQPARRFSPPALFGRALHNQGFENVQRE